MILARLTKALHKMAAIALDRIDRLLLAERQRSARLTNAELAERVHMSASAALRRVQRLERSFELRTVKAFRGLPLPAR